MLILMVFPKLSFQAKLLKIKDQHQLTLIYLKQVKFQDLGLLRLEKALKLYQEWKEKEED